MHAGGQVLENVRPVTLSYEPDEPSGCIVRKRHWTSLLAAAQADRVQLHYNAQVNCCLKSLQEDAVKSKTTAALLPILDCARCTCTVGKRLFMLSASFCLPINHWLAEIH